MKMPLDCNEEMGKNSLLENSGNENKYY